MKTMNHLTQTMIYSLMTAAWLLVVAGEASAQDSNGACCLGDGNCVETNQADCETEITLGGLGGEFLGEGTLCSEADCLGACCLDDGTCTLGSANACVAGVYQGAGSTCEEYCPGPLSTGFTYQGQLKENGAPVTNTIDLEASLWTAAIGGDPVGTPVMLASVVVVNGLFTVQLDFGADALSGNARFLEVAVRSPHDPTDTGPFTTLIPRQPVTATPYAIQTRGISIGDDGNVTFDSLNAVEGTVTMTSIGGIDLILDADTNNSGEDQNARVVMRQDGGQVVGRMGYREGGNELEIMQEWNSDLILGTNNQDHLTIRPSGFVGIGTTTPSYTLHVESTGGRAIFGHNTAGSGNTYGVYGRSFSTNGRGVYGEAIAGSGLNFGVWGQSHSTSGRGVFGWATVNMGTTTGVWGQSDSLSGFDFFAGGLGTDYGSASSIRWKSNVEPIDRPLEKIARLRGVYYDWDAEHGGHHDVGMIAEEVGAVLPEIVQYEENGIDAVGMDYSKLTPLLVEAVKELSVKLEQRDAEMSALRAEKDAEIEGLKKTLREMQNDLAALAAEMERRKDQ